MALTDTTESNSPPTAPFVPIASRAWWHRHLDPEERRRVMDELAITRVEYWAWRFTIMLTLSVVVAVMGLSADSAAVVIGAMLLAPLMQPVLATAACLSMSLIKKSFQGLLRTALATAWCIGIAFLLSTVLPDGPLAGEVEARTRPDIRDLVVALAAGAAGAYATVRRDASASLPGVAVAVALVPPLATIGITLEADELDLAIGASLLYGTNLAAIIFAGVMVFIATGFVPPRRLANTAVQLLVAAVLALAIVVIVAVPLYNRSAEAVAAAEEELAARSIVEQWLGGVDLVPAVDVDDGRVFVQLRGFDPPPDDTELRVALREQLGAVTVNVEWIRTERATTTTTIVVEPSDDETLIATVRPVIDRWLADSSGGLDYEIDRVRLDEGVLKIDVTGTGDPPSVDELIQRLATEVDYQLPVTVNWDRREAISPARDVTPTELLEQQVIALVDAWADEFGVVATAVAFDGERVHIEAVGSEEPRINRLVDDVHEIVGEIDRRPVPVDVFFTRQQRLTTTLIVVDGFGELVPLAPTTTTVAAGPTPTSAGG